MAGEDVRTRVRRISLLLDGSPPTSPDELRAHADPSLVVRGFGRLLETRREDRS